MQKFASKPKLLYVTSLARFRFYGPRGIPGPQKRKQKRGQYPAILTKQAWSIKDVFWAKDYTNKFRGQSRVG